MFIRRGSEGSSCSVFVNSAGRSIGALELCSTDPGKGAHCRGGSVERTSGDVVLYLFFTERLDIDSSKLQFEFQQDLQDPPSSGREVAPQSFTSLPGTRRNLQHFDDLLLVDSLTSLSEPETD